MENRNTQSLSSRNGPGANRWTRLWDFLTLPHSKLTEVGIRRQARLLAGVSLFMAIMAGLGVGGSLSAGHRMMNAYLLGGLTLTGIISYIFSRSPYLTPGTSLLVFVFAALGYFNGFTSTGQSVEATLSFLPLAYLVAAALLSSRGNIVFSAANTLFTLVLWIAPQLFPPTEPGYPGTIFGQTITMGSLLIIATTTRDAIERARLTEVKKVNAELQNLSESLELRVDERTRDIALAAEIGRKISLVHDLDRLLMEAVELIRDRFNLYYAQVYLVDKVGRSLVLKAGTGEAGREMMRAGHRLVADQVSINGSALLEKRIVVVPDTRSSSIFRPNPLLRETRSEMSVPLIVGDRVLGVLDLQANRVNELTSENISVFETLAAQISTALLNAELFAQVERSLEEAERQTRETVREGWDSYLNGIDQKHRIGYIFENGQISPLAEPLTLSTTDPSSLSAQITVAGEPVGALQFLGDHKWSSEDTELVRMVSNQVAQQVENLRLLGQAGRYRIEAEEAVRRLTREEWSDYVIEEAEAASFVYEGNQVQPVDAEARGGEGDDKPSVTIDITVNNQKIGELGVDGVNNLSPQDEELVMVISEQLGAHLENMRLYATAQQEVNERRKTEGLLAKRAAETQALYEGTRQLARGRNFEDVLRSVVDNSPLKQFESIAIILFDRPWNEGPKTVRVVAAQYQNEAEAPFQVGMFYPIEAFGQFSRFSDRQVLLINDTATDPRLSEDVRASMLQQKTQSSARWPLLVGGDWIGAFSATSQSVKDLTDDDILRISSLVDQAGSVIQSLQLLEQIQRALNETANLYLASRHLNEARTLQDMISAIMNGFRVSEINRSLLMLFERDDTGMVEKVEVAANWYNGQGIQPMPVGTKYPIQTFKSMPLLSSTPEPLFFHNVKTDSRIDATALQSMAQQKIAALASLPLFISGRQIGALILEAEIPHQFTDDEIRGLQALSSQLAIAVESRRLFENVQDRARREQMLREITARVRGSMDPDSILRTAVRELGTALGRPAFVRLGSAEQLSHKPGNGSGNKQDPSHPANRSNPEGGPFNE